MVTASKGREKEEEETTRGLPTDLSLPLKDEANYLVFSTQVPLPPQSLTEDVDSPLVHSNPQGTPPMLHGSYKRPRFRLHVIALHTVQLVLTVVAPGRIDTVVQDTHS